MRCIESLKFLVFSQREEYHHQPIDEVQDDYRPALYSLITSEHLYAKFFLRMIPGEPITLFKPPEALTIYGSSVITGATNLITSASVCDFFA